MATVILKRAWGFMVSSGQVTPRAKSTECVWRRSPQFQATPPLRPLDPARVMAHAECSQGRPVDATPAENVLHPLELQPVIRGDHRSRGDSSLRRCPKKSRTFGKQFGARMNFREWNLFQMSHE
jgi:hypothetical protein